MEENEVLSKLCCFDKRHPTYLPTLTVEMVHGSNKCRCINCESGVAKMAEYILDLKEMIEESKHAAWERDLYSREEDD